MTDKRGEWKRGRVPWPMSGMKLEWKGSELGRGSECGCRWQENIKSLCFNYYYTIWEICLIVWVTVTYFLHKRSLNWWTLTLRAIAWSLAHIVDLVAIIITKLLVWNFKHKNPLALYKFLFKKNKIISLKDEAANQVQFLQILVGCCPGLHDVFILAECAFGWRLQVGRSLQILMMLIPTLVSDRYCVQ